MSTVSSPPTAEMSVKVLHAQFPLLDLAFQPATPMRGTVRIRWQHHEQRYVYVYRQLNTPKAVRTAALELSTMLRKKQTRPLLIAPHLSAERLEMLMAFDVSGMDMSGNCNLLADSFSVRHTGQPNQFPLSQIIRNVFRGRSSLISQCFLLQREFKSLTALRDYANERMQDKASAPLTLGTASKVVQALEEQLIVAREDSTLTLIHADGLMKGLEQHYQPASGTRLVGKTRMDKSKLWRQLHHAGLVHVTTGESSAAHYGVLSSPDVLSFYVHDLPAAVELLDVQETRVFPNVQLVEETADTVYFDARPDESGIWASPIQTWLELSHAGPREREAAKILATSLRKGTVR